MVGTNLESSNTLRRSGIPPDFLIRDLMLSTVDKFHRALAAFSCKVSSVGEDKHWISALMPPASAIITALSSCAPRFVRVIAVTARNVCGRPTANKGTSFGIPLNLLMTVLHSSSTARFRTAPAAPSLTASGTPTSKSSSSNPRPSSSRILALYWSSRAKLPTHSAALPTVTMSGCFSKLIMSFSPPWKAISALLSSSTVRFLRAPAAARIQASFDEDNILTSTSAPLQCLIISRFSRSSARFSKQLAALSFVRSCGEVATRSTIFLIEPDSRMAPQFSGCTAKLAMAPKALATMPGSLLGASWSSEQGSRSNNFFKPPA
mmetsp:Transcript_53751/g.143844  ORF Transcript_53751/g.143844 Transcript_53751/m.143844 type:complete len:320 (-) Transcript_53751:525-1484(-)